MKRILVMEGDRRQGYAGKRLQEKLGSLPETEVLLAEKETPIPPYDIAVLPVQGCALLSAKRLEQLVEKAAPGGWILGGMFREQEKRLFQQHGLMIDAYAERESFARRNAIPTAEGALQRILEQTPYTIQGSTAFVLGFGRVGTALSLRLIGLGAMVFVWDSDPEAIRRAKGYGLPICSPEQLPELLPRCDLVVNTVPEQVLTEPQLSRIHREALLLDLASAPGGVSKEIVQSLSFCYFWATSLPPGMLG